MVRRPAFTLIELIFAIVIIAITVVSLPMMNQAIAKGISGNIVQEAIFAAAGELNEAVTANWDENSTEPDTAAYARVIETTGLCDSSTRLMPGHIMQPLHRRCLESNTTRPANTIISDVNALNDMAHGANPIFLNYTQESAGYKDNYQSILTVSKDASFGVLTDNASIKKISIEIMNSSNKTIVKLTTYSFDIGEIDYYHWSY